MSSADPPAFHAALEEYQQEAEALFDASKSGDEAAEWRFKWVHPLDVARLLVERGARLDLRDTVYQGTPLGWVIYGERTAIAE